MLLSAEYLLLEGSEALALPVKFDQHLYVTENSSSDINWTSFDQKNEIWFSAKFSLYDFKASDSSDQDVSDKITKLLKACARQDSEFLSQWKGQKIETKLDFNREWGLGTSSSLIYCIAEWADVSPYQLLMDTFGGSGYDIACAGADGPIIYKIKDYVISIEEASFYPPFINNLFFVYSGNKQNSQKEVLKFQQAKNFTTTDIDTASHLTRAFNKCTSLDDFQRLISEHESLISKIIKTEPVKKRNFQDFEGEIKSLGAWGGDFILIATKHDRKYVEEYFNKKNLKDFFAYDELILKR